MNRLLAASIAGLLVLGPQPAAGQAQTEPETEWAAIRKGLAASFALPWRDLLKKKHNSEWRNLVDGFAGSFGADGPLQAPAVPGRTGGLHWTDARLSASVKYTPLGYWFVTGSVYKYLNPANQRSWSPDFTYAFGFDDWHPYTLSLVYANYGGNRVDAARSANGQRTNLAEGGITLAWKVRVPGLIDRVVAATKAGSTGASVGYTWTPRYADATGQTRAWKQKAQLNVKHTFYKAYYVNATLYYYPRPEQQQAWDPDFTYGFGYFDWRPGTLSVQYNNYAGNRFPFRATRGARFRDGSFSVSWSWSSTQ
jgi:hypothetical protein